MGIRFMILMVYLTCLHNIKQAVWCIPTLINFDVILMSATSLVIETLAQVWGLNYIYGLNPESIKVKEVA